jgi:hypothetical protein
MGENEKKDRFIDLDRARFLDEDGGIDFNSWYATQNASRGGSPDSSLGFLGTEPVCNQVAAIPTKNNPLHGIQLVTEVDSLGPTLVKYGQPHYAYAVFSKVPTDVKRIAHLICTFNLSQPGEFNRRVDYLFNDIPITPMPQVK